MKKAMMLTILATLLLAINFVSAGINDIDITITMEEPADGTISGKDHFAIKAVITNNGPDINSPFSVQTYINERIHSTCSGQCELNYDVPVANGLKTGQSGETWFSNWAGDEFMQIGENKLKFVLTLGTDSIEEIFEFNIIETDLPDVDLELRNPGIDRNNRKITAIKINMKNNGPNLINDAVLYVNFCIDSLDGNQDFGCYNFYRDLRKAECNENDCVMDVGDEFLFVHDRQDSLDTINYRLSNVDSFKITYEIDDVNGLKKYEEINKANSKIEEIFSLEGIPDTPETEDNMDTCLDNPSNYWDQETDSCKSGYSESIIPSLCSDPDGGTNYFQEAHTFGFRSYSTAADPSRDLRIRTGGKDYCNPENGQLHENYCDDNGYIQTLYFDCPQGCSTTQGACIGSAETDIKIKDIEITPEPHLFTNGRIIITPIIDFVGLDLNTHFFISTTTYNEDGEEVEGCGTRATYQKGGFINLECDLELYKTGQYTFVTELDTEREIPEAYRENNILKKTVQMGEFNNDLSEGECYDSDDGKDFFMLGKTYDEGEQWPSYDFCEGETLTEYYCDYNKETDLYYRTEVEYKCEWECQGGACIKEDSIEREKCNSGCFSNDKCYPFGYRKSGDYCSGEGSFTPQLESDYSCENSFECKSNVCVDGKCISGGLLRRIIEWFKRLFS